MKLNTAPKHLRTVTGQASAVFGPGGFDLEAWNELTFRSQFLNAERCTDAAGSAKANAEAGHAI